MAGFSTPYFSYNSAPPMPPSFPNQTMPKMPGSSGLAAYAQPFQPSSAMFAPQYQQFNMAGGPLSGGPMAEQRQTPNGEEDTPWYKNPAILNTIAGAGSAILQNNNAAAQRRQEQQRIDLQRQSYEDQHKRAQATSDAINPIIARLLGQMISPRQG